MERRFFKPHHPGIRIDKIPASGFAGLLFTVATATVFLAVPEVRSFFALSLVGGLAVAASLYYWHNQTRW